jgi:membrane protease subunit (stomatin/prohibitin family)
MGLFGFGGKKEGGTADPIRCDQEDYLIWKWRPKNSEVNSTDKENAIRWGSALRVKDGEVAVFVYKQNGGTQDFIVGPHDRLIETANLPVLSNILGLLYDGGTPFQAEVYFINMAGNIQVPFGISKFDVFDYRYTDIGVPVVVRGSITFNVSDYKAFVKLNRLIQFDIDTFRDQIQDAVERYVKGIVANVSTEHKIQLVQIERRILDVNDWVAQKVKPYLENYFAINIKRLDISAVEVIKESEGYQKLRELTADIDERKAKVKANIDINTLEAQSEVVIENLRDTQRINTDNLEEQLRLQREAMQRAQKLQTESTYFETHKLNIQTDAQKEVLKAAAENLGAMGTADLGGGSSMNPAGMMTGMMMGSAMGNQMANMMNQMGNSMSATNMGANVPPPPPVSNGQRYLIVIGNNQAGPFSIQELQGLFLQGQFTAQSYVWKQGMPNWAPAGQLLDLQSIFGSVPPPIPPPIPPQQ